MGCDSSCQSLLLPRRVLLNLNIYLYSHWPGDTSVTRHKYNPVRFIFCVLHGRKIVSTCRFALANVIAHVVVHVQVQVHATVMLNLLHALTRHVCRFKPVTSDWLGVCRRRGCGVIDRPSVCNPGSVKE